MDQCQIPGAKMGGSPAVVDPISPGGIRIKEDCRCDFAEAGEKCDVHDKKGSKSSLKSMGALSHPGAVLEDAAEPIGKSRVFHA